MLELNLYVVTHYTNALSNLLHRELESIFKYYL